jgi:hypothetical protein
MINQGWKVQITNSTAMPVSGVMTVTGGTIAITGGTVSVTGDVDVLQGLAIPQHDYISLTYSGSSLTGVVYKDGGSGGSTVATLALTYSGSNLTSVTKS